MEEDYSSELEQDSGENDNKHIKYLLFLILCVLVFIAASLVTIKKQNAETYGAVQWITSFLETNLSK